MVLLSADGSEEKVYKKITVADPTSCKKKRKKKWGGGGKGRKGMLKL